MYLGATVSRLIDKSGQNPSLYCSRCQMSFDPEYDSLRKVRPREKKTRKVIRIAVILLFYPRIYRDALYC
jgi:hypothetical protein